MRGGMALALLGLWLQVSVVYPAHAAPAPSTAPAAPVDHRITVKVTRTEPLDAFARRYYGAAPAVQALLVANGLPAWEERLPQVKPGQTMHLPTAWSYRARSGDTWALLAKDYLGDAGKASFLAQLNGVVSTEAIAVDRVIDIPALLHVKVPKGVSLGRMAALFQEQSERDPESQAQAKRIREYNGLKGDRVPPGSEIIVPLPALRLLGSHLATALPPEDPGTQRRALVVVWAAREDLKTGRFLAALEALGPLLGVGGLRGDLLGEVHVLRCTALVALEQPALALTAARAALAAQPALRLDPVQVSPKVIAVFEKARGALSPGRPPRPPSSEPQPSSPAPPSRQ